jgi:acetyl esterase/lipase
MEQHQGVSSISPQQKFWLWPEPVLSDEPVAASSNQLRQSGGQVSGSLEINDVPSLTFYPATQANGLAVLVCPGGAYNRLADQHEGVEVCQWLNSLDITCGLLRYRIPRVEGRPKHERAMADFRRAMVLMESLSRELIGTEGRLGVIGFSAGGHLSVMGMASTEVGSPPDGAKVETAVVRPDFAVLVYPAYLLAEDSNSRLAPEFTVTASFPPSFIVVAQDDEWADDSLRFYWELQQNKVPAELHVFAKGGHGFGISKPAGEVQQWPRLVEGWLRTRGLV